MSMVEPFNLFANPFVRLGLTPRDTEPAILEAVQNALAKRPQDEAHLLAARRTLMASRARARAELRMLSDVPPARAKLLLQSLRQGILPSELSEMGALTRANAAAHICCDAQAAGGASALRQLVEAAAELQPETLLNSLNQNRHLAGFPLLPLPLVAEELPALRADYVSAAMLRLRRLTDPTAELMVLIGRLPERALMNENALAAEQFLTKLAERYRQNLTSELAAAERGLRRKLDMLLHGPVLEGLLADTLNDLRQWSLRLRPLQTLEARRQLDETASRRLADDILGLLPALLARDAQEGLQSTPQNMGQNMGQDEQRAGAALLLALEEAFGILPDFAAQLATFRLQWREQQDVARREQAAAALNDTLAAARRDWAAFLQALRNGQFRLGGNGLAGQMMEQLRALALLDPEAPAPWLAVLQLAESLLVQPQGAPPARAILRGLVALGQADDGATPLPAPAQAALRSLSDRLALHHTAQPSPEGAAPLLKPASHAVAFPAPNARAEKASDFSSQNREKAPASALEDLSLLIGNLLRAKPLLLSLVAAGLGILLGALLISLF